MKIRSIVAAGAVVLAGIQSAVASVGPLVDISPTFTQSSFNFNGANTTVVGHLSLFLSVSDPILSPFYSVLVEGITPSGFPPTSMTVGAPFASILELNGSTPGCSTSVFDQLQCTLSGDITFVGPGNYNGGVFGARATLFEDNGSISVPGNTHDPIGTNAARFVAVEPSSGVPEPWSVALLGAGLAGLALSRRRAKR